MRRAFFSGGIVAACLPSGMAVTSSVDEGRRTQVRWKLAYGVALAAAVCASLLASSTALAGAAPQSDQVARLEECVKGLQSQLDRVESKLDRLDATLRRLYGDRLARLEALAADEALAAAVKSVEARYGIAGVADAITSDDLDGLVGLHRKLASAAAEHGRAEFARDPDIHRILAAMAARREYLQQNGRRLILAIAGQDAGAAGSLVAGLLDSKSAAAHEAALWAAPRAEGERLAARLSEYAARIGPDDIRLDALAQAAATAHGDARAAGRLAELAATLVRSALPATSASAAGEPSSGGAPGRRGREGTPYAAAGKPGARFCQEIAAELAAAGSPIAFSVYAELLRDESYAFAAAQAFARINGFQRRIGWSEVKEKREEVYKDFRAWLGLNGPRLRYDRQRMMFYVEEAPNAPAAPAAPEEGRGAPPAPREPAGRKAR